MGAQISVSRFSAEGLRANGTLINIGRRVSRRAPRAAHVTGGASGTRGGRNGLGSARRQFDRNPGRKCSGSGAGRTDTIGAVASVVVSYHVVGMQDDVPGSRSAQRIGFNLARGALAIFLHVIDFDGEPVGRCKANNFQRG